MLAGSFYAFFICGSYRVHISMIKRGSQRQRYSRAIAEPKTKKKVMGEGVRGEMQKEMPFVRSTPSPNSK